MDKRPRLPFAATLLALTACYGTLAVLAILGALGIAIGLNERVWAGTIIAFAAMAAIGLFAARQRHGQIWPALLGTAGAALVTYSMVAGYSLAVELLGFALLVAATAWDWRLGSTSA